MYERINQLLSTDFVPRVPVEVSDIIFNKLNHQDLITASQTCKQWNERSMREPIWAKLCKTRKWNELERELTDPNDQTKYRSLYRNASQLNRVWLSGNYTSDCNLNLH